VTVGSDQTVAVGQAPEPTVAGDAAGIAFNAQAMTILAQIAVAEASWHGVSLAGTMPALRVPRTAVGPC
jgi:hypothetical protein